MSALSGSHSQSGHHHDSKSKAGGSGSSRVTSRHSSSGPQKEQSHHQPHSVNIVPLKEVLSSADESVDSKHLKMRHDPIRNVSLFGVDLSRLQPWAQAAILMALILCGFISIGYVEEGFKFEFEDFSFGWFMTAAELFIFSLFAMTERLFKGLATITSAVYLSSASTVHLAADSERESLLETRTAANPRTSSTASNGGTPSTATAAASATSNAASIGRLCSVNWLNIVFEAQMPIKYHVLVAAAMMCSRALTNIALLLLNYPTQVIFKSMKLISVMVGSVCCLKQQYDRCEYIAAPVLVLSAVLFTFGDANDLSFNALGIVVVSVSLIFDAIHANAQQLVLQAQTERDTTLELLVYSNLLAAAMAFVVSFCCGEVTQIQYEYLPAQPPSTALRLFLWFLVRVICLYVGVSAFVVFIKRFGAVFGVTITTIRKILTVLLSYVFYPGKKAFIPLQHGTGTVLFVLSLILAGYGSIKKKERQKRTRR